MAHAAALEDPRFPPVSEAELESLQVEISVLSPMFEIAPEDVVVGRHGLMVSHPGTARAAAASGGSGMGMGPADLAGTDLPQGRSGTGYVGKRGAKLEAFTAEVFGETEPGESLRE